MHARPSCGERSSIPQCRIPKDASVCSFGMHAKVCMRPGTSRWLPSQSGSLKKLLQLQSRASQTLTIASGSGELNSRDVTVQGCPQNDNQNRKHSGVRDQVRFVFGSWRCCSKDRPRESHKERSCNEICWSPTIKCF